jgi:MFS family permease
LINSSQDCDELLPGGPCSPFLLPKRKSILSDAFSTLKMMLKNDKIFIVYAAAIFSYLLIMTIPALSAPFVSEVLSGNTIQFGFIEASFSVGAIIGCILLPKFSFFMGMPKKILLISLIQIFVLLAFSFVHYYWLAIILYFSAGITMGLFPIFTAMTQLITKPEWQKVVMANYMFVLITYVKLT